MDPFGNGFDSPAGPGGFDVSFLVISGFIVVVGLTVVAFIIVFFVRLARGGVQPPTIIVRTENGAPASDASAPAAASRRRGMLRNQQLLNDQMNQNNLNNQINQQNLLNDQLNQQNIINQQNNGMP